MKTAIPFILSLFLFHSAVSQFNENFSDGDFTNNPVWQGDTAYFVVNANFELQSQGPSNSSEIYLTTDFDISSNSVWEFYTRCDLATSSSNYARFYLTSIDDSLNSNPYAYYIKLGGESGNTDGIDLYVENSAGSTKLIDGTEGIFGFDTNEARIRVTKDYYGNWSLFADTSGQTNFTLLGTAFDSSITIDKHFGIFCKHTSTRRDKFHFDDISIKNGSFDLLSASVKSSNTVLLQFSNPVNPNLTFNYTDFILSPQNSYPSSVQINSQNRYQLLLQFAHSFSAGNYSIEVASLFDNQNIPLQNDRVSFSYLPHPTYREIVINEIMYDPEPIIGLPAKEYVEIFNTSNSDFNMAGLVFSDITTSTPLTEKILRSGEYLILCDVRDTAEFKQFGEVLGLEKWPSLNNSGDEVSLKVIDGPIIDLVEYEASWTHSSKQDGGWSLERINPYKKCSDQNNWQSSVNNSGGTPGYQNSLFDDSPDMSPPEIESIDVLSFQKLELHFSENLSLFLNKDLILFQPAEAISFIEFFDRSIGITLQSGLDSGRIYSITIDSITDCEGNTAFGLNVLTGIGRKPDYFEIVINEIMCDPEPVHNLPNSEYFELYNTTNDIISLSNLILISGNDSSEIEEYNLFPKEYLIICPTSKTSEFESYGKCYGLSPWLSLNNEDDNISLFQKEKKIHEVKYSQKWIQDLQKQEGGWSLEMIDPSSPCAKSSNWTGSEHPSGGSPGKKNSVFSKKSDYTNPKIERITIPKNDELEIKFSELIDAQLLHSGNIHLSPKPDIEEFHFPERYCERIGIKLTEELSPNINYLFEIENLTDCVININALEQKGFILPEKANVSDIVINEILFDPHTGSPEFIEIYNRSNKNIDLKNYSIASLNEDSSINSRSILSSDNLILEKSEFLLLTIDTSTLKNFYPRSQSLFQIDKLLTFNNESAFIALVDSNDFRIDSIRYFSDYHLPILSDAKGVSLERISTEMSSMDPNNWTSAAEAYGFATPGYINSQNHSQSNLQDNIFIEPSIFSPDGDGYKDLVMLGINSSGNEEIVSITIYDTRGSLIKTISNNHTIGVKNQYFWDGVDERGNLAFIGNYIALFDIYDLNGNRNRVKKVFSLARRN